MVLCACGRIGFDHGGVGGGDGGSDGSAQPDGAMGGLCVGAVPATTFPGGLPCGNWGANVMMNNSGVSESNGTLSITPNANSAGAGGSCQRDGVTFTAAGVFAEVSQVLGGMNATTRLELIAGGVTYFIGATNNGMRSGNSEGVSFSGGNVARWWRIRPIGEELHFETSPDGEVWRSIASLGFQVMGPVQLRVSATTPVAEGNAGSARFESVNVCPP